MLIAWINQKISNDLKGSQHPITESTNVTLADEIDVTVREVISSRSKAHEKRTQKPVLARAPAGHQPASLMLHPKRDRIDSKSIKHAVDVITGVSAASNAERLRAVASLYETELPEDEASRLLNYLKDANRQTGMSDAAMHVLVNELVAIFHDQPVLSDAYLKVSKHVISDKSQHEVVRDYTLQGLSRSIGNASPEQEETIRGVFWNSLHETGTSLSGTALLALDLERRTGNLSAGEVRRLNEHVTQILKDLNVGERTRIPAIRISVELELEDPGSELVRIFHSEASTSSEKVAALSALNILGDQETLATALNSGDPLISRAAQRIKFQN